ncbi:paxt-1 [Pristionchus pacificus]|uniref:Paxt-1 n=1 Tax=Pristionchus pacificus TaxID=54126 RepID=A0A2A6C9S3_PRIPA|nr:paxt-1 [Pristionchus pacificus]|eukprot:PDM74830.1 paxt-1 [Pristionchus pacificus]
MSEELQQGEADRVARKRFAFQRANKDVMKDADQLAAYAAVYANMAALGCVYPDEVMRRIKLMSDNVEDGDDKEMRSLVLASRGRAHAAKQRQETEDTNEPRHNNNGRHALSEMRENLLMSHREASGIEMIDWASKRLNLRWNMTEQDGETKVYVANSVTRNLNKAAKNPKLTAGRVTKAIMTSVFDDVNLPFTITTKHVQGWEQQVELRSAELLLAQKTLKKGECVKAKMDAAIDDMCEDLSARLTSAPIRLENSQKGLNLL